MILETYKIRVIANACITRFTKGEGTIKEILGSYNLSEENETLVLERIYSLRPDLKTEDISE